jgi:hypothetical protein
MPFPDIKDVGILAGFERWGCPYHGLATGGIIAGSGQAVSQPIGGDTYVLRVPGVAPLDLTPAQIASDAANHFEWLDYAILAGYSQKLYGGPSLGPLGWIYASADGSRWWIKLTSSANITGNSQTFTFQVKRFGEFMPSGELVTETYTRTVALSDCGQSTPTVTLHSGIETGTGTYDYTVNTYSLFLEDTKPDGSVAVFGLQNMDPLNLLNWTPAWFAGEPMSMGFLAVTVSDGASGPTIAVAVMHTRAESLGTYEYHPTDPDVGRRIVSDRIIAVWFDGDTPHPVKLSMDIVSDRKTVPTGSCSSSGNYTFSLAWSSKTADFVCSAFNASSNAGSPTYIVTGTYNYSFEAGLLSASADYSFDNGGDGTSTQLWPGVQFWWDNYLHSASPPQAYHAAFILAADSYAATVGSTVTGKKAYVCLKRLNNKQFCFLGMTFDTLAEVVIDTGGGGYHWDQTNDMVWLGGFTPAGKDSLQGALGVHINVVPSGTTHPTTGVPSIRADGVPICHV